MSLWYDCCNKMHLLHACWNTKHLQRWKVHQKRWPLLRVKITIHELEYYYCYISHIITWWVNETITIIISLLTFAVSSLLCSFAPHTATFQERVKNNTCWKNTAHSSCFNLLSHLTFSSTTTRWHCFSQSIYCFLNKISFILSLHLVSR